MDMASVRLSLDMELFHTILMVAAVLSTEPLKVLLAMEVMDMVTDMARGLLMLDTMAVPALTSSRAVLTTMDPMGMVSTTMAGGQLMPDTMAVPALMSSRAVLTTMDPMAMVSTTMAEGQLMLDITAMELELAATSKLAVHTPHMGSVLLTLTKS
jgi:hypothetical protein